MSSAFVYELTRPLIFKPIWVTDGVHGTKNTAVHNPVL